MPGIETMFFTAEDILKLVLAVLLGGMIGIEREFRDKTAGFRTIIFICMGATLFTIFSMQLGGDNDPTRIAANIVTGVGFLGAGVLLRNEGRIIGLTTASIIWLTAAIGMGIGSGQYGIAIITAVFTLLIIWIFPYIEHFIDSIRDERIYEIAMAGTSDRYKQMDALFQDCRLKIHSKKQFKSGSELVYVVDIIGPPKCHDKLVSALLADPEIISFKS
jgi:putative Mg2+ transporter-C (MgtC) family protein